MARIFLSYKKKYLVSEFLISVLEDTVQIIQKNINYFSLLANTVASITEIKLGSENLLLYIKFGIDGMVALFNKT